MTKKSKAAVPAASAGKKKKSSLNAEKRKKFLLKVWKQKTLLLMAFVPVMFVVVFNYIPMYGILIAFKDYKASKGVWGSDWLNPIWKNFEVFFKNVNSGRVIWNTFKLGILQVLFTFPAPIAFAILLNELKGNTYKRVVQTISYIPHFVSVVVICTLLNGFGSLNGLFNDVRDFLGMARVDMNNGATYFYPMYIGSAVWQTVGWGSIIYLSALSNVDTSLYDVANIDGANRWEKIKNIVFPTILPTTTILLIMNMGGILNTGFTKVLLMQNNTNRSALDTLGTFTYQKGIVEGRFAYSTAVGLFVAVVNFVMVYATNAITRKINSENSMW